MAEKIDEKLYEQDGKVVSLDEVIDKKISEAIGEPSAPIPVFVEEQLGPKEIFRRTR